MSVSNAAEAVGKSARLGEGPVVMVLGMPHVVKVSADQNLGGTSVMEVVVAPGQGVPPHTHTREDEFFCILQGEITCQMVGFAAPVTLKAGDFLFLPRNRMHGFTNASGKEARMLVTVSPGAGADRMFAELETACQKFSDPQHLMPEVGRICGSYGITFAPLPQ
jgi:quercetin dioxygenase-like cupin family protein